MSSIILRPDQKYQTKLFLAVGLLGALIVAFSVVLAVLIGNEEGGQEGVQTGLTIAVLANLVWLVPSFLLVPFYYRSLRYEIQEDEVIVRVGVITRSVKHVPFRTVTNLEVKRDPLDRMLGIGTLKIQTAGMSGQSGAEESLVGLPSYQAVYEQVAAALRRFRGSIAPTQAEVETEPDGAKLLPAILGELRAIREVLERRG